MRLRIISGILKGRFISIPEDNKQFRPTLERTRESVSEILKPFISNARVADICAGSGAFGFEMLSRGADWVDFVEKDRRRAKLLIENAQKLNIADSCCVFTQDIRSFVNNSRGGYDIVYYDPPYADTELKTVIPQLKQLLSEDGILVYEKARESSGSADLHEPYATRVFGDTVVHFYHRETNP
ncbi:MAG: methyltransferase [Fibrobacter sp.]|nr:methyltransferase [Fibrobacter sp.]